MIKRFLRRIRLLFGLIDTKRTDKEITFTDPYPLNSSNEIQVTYTEEPYKFVRNTDLVTEDSTVTIYDHERNRIFDGRGIEAQIDCFNPSDNPPNQSSESYDSGSSEIDNNSNEF